MRAKKTIQVVVLALIQKENKYLFTLRNDGDSTFNGQWQIPGGGHEFGETPEETLRREVREELGVEVKNVRLVPHIETRVRGDWQGIFISYLCEMKNEDDKIVLNDEAIEYRWLTSEEVAALPFISGCKEILDAVPNLNF